MHLSPRASKHRDCRRLSGKLFMFIQLAFSLNKRVINYFVVVMLTNLWYIAVACIMGTKDGKGWQFKSIDTLETSLHSEWIASVCNVEECVKVWKWKLIYLCILRLQHTCAIEQFFLKTQLKNVIFLSTISSAIIHLNSIKKINK